jgi:PAP2 superfamily
MQNLMLGWQPAALTAGGLAAVALPDRLYRLTHWPAAVRQWPIMLRRRVSVASGVAWETALLFGLYALWQLAGWLAHASVARAVPRGRSIWHVERVLGLPIETAVQRAVLPHPLLVQVADLYYDILHFPVLIACLIWLYFWHREHYRKMRTLLVIVTGASLIIQLFLPVAPPRLIGGTGLVDTAMVYHQSVYGSFGLDAAQMSAMPSVHVAWAMIVAIAVITTLRSRWRWLATGYPVLTTLVVVVTANHYWLDCAVAAGLVAVAAAVRGAVARGWDAATARPEPSPVGLSAGPGRRHSRVSPQSALVRSSGRSGRYHHTP